MTLTMTLTVRSYLLVVLIVQYFLIAVSSGNGIFAPQSEFVLNAATSVSTSLLHGCTIEAKMGSEFGGRARCWGFDVYSQLSSPEDIEFVQIAVGSSFSCGIAVDQTVHCWGSIDSDPPGLFRQISIGCKGHFLCGIVVDGSIECWGGNRFTATKPKGGQYNQISCSAIHCCALNQAGHIDCWADEMYMEFPELETPKLTYNDYYLNRNVSQWMVNALEELQEVEAVEDADKDRMVFDVQFRQIAVSDRISCGITMIGAHIICWGRKEFFQKHTIYRLPRHVEGPFRSVSVGPHGFCGIRGSYEEIVAELELIDRVASEPVAHDTWNRSSATDFEYSLHCWGPIANKVPTQQTIQWDQVAVGEWTVCGISMQSQLHCWGNTIPEELSLERDIVIA